MQFHPRSQVHFLIQDLKWPNAIDRFRSPSDPATTDLCGDWDELYQAFTANLWSFSVIEVLPDQAALWLRRIGRLARFAPNHRIAVVGSRELRPYSRSLCEAGAVLCGFSLSDCFGLARFIDRFVESHPPQPLPLRESIFESLPWANTRINDAPSNHVR